MVRMQWVLHEAPTLHMQRLLCVVHVLHVLHVVHVVLVLHVLYELFDVPYASITVKVDYMSSLLLLPVTLQVRLQRAADLVCEVLSPTNASFDSIKVEPGGSARLTIAQGSRIKPGALKQKVGVLWCSRPWKRSQ